MMQAKHAIASRLFPFGSRQSSPKCQAAKRSRHRKVLQTGSVEKWCDNRLAMQGAPPVFYFAVPPVQFYPAKDRAMPDAGYGVKHATGGVFCISDFLTDPCTHYAGNGINRLSMK